MCLFFVVMNRRRRVKYAAKGVIAALRLYEGGCRYRRISCLALPFITFSKRKK